MNAAISRNFSSPSKPATASKSSTPTRMDSGARSRPGSGSSSLPRSEKLVSFSPKVKPSPRRSLFSAAGSFGGRVDSSPSPRKTSASVSSRTHNSEFFGSPRPSVKSSRRSESPDLFADESGSQSFTQRTDISDRSEKLRVDVDR